MKVRFKYGIRTYSGTADDMTYCSYRKGTVCIGRKHTSPRITAQNTSMGVIMKNLAKVYSECSAGYKAELKTYASKYEALVPKNKVAPGAYPIFVKMMFLFAELDAEHIDLATITHSDLLTVGTDIQSVADAVANSYLPNVSGADELTTNM
mgnify:CR=1 FL=1